LQNNLLALAILKKPHEGVESELALGVDDVASTSEENAVKENSCGPEELESITHGDILFGCIF
jgi:hypothetical protein